MTWKLYALFKILHNNQLPMLSPNFKLSQADLKGFT